VLPAPSQSVWDRDEERSKIASPITAVVAHQTAPPYGARRGWVPRNAEVGMLQTLYTRYANIIVNGNLYG